MREKPILFSAPMVRAILDGSKSQTRRVCKPANESALSQVVGPFDCPELGPGHFGDEEGDLQFLCPYGQPGDRLWVRETWRPADGMNKPGDPVTYAADWPDAAVKWKPSIHMPRAASRILLEIVSVRVERLNECSREDAAAEGICHMHETGGGDGLCILRDDNWPEQNFATLWDAINGVGAWAGNPWVWVVEFKRVQA